MAEQLAELNKGDDYDSGWTSVTGTYANKIFYRKIGKLVNVRAASGVLIPVTTSYVQLFTLPVGFRPSLGFASIEPASVSNITVAVKFDTTGAVSVAATTAVNLWSMNTFFYVD